MRFNRTGGYLNGRVGGKELKFFDITEGPDIISVTGTMTNSTLNNMVQGTGQQERIGRKCVIRSISVQWHANMPPVTDVSVTHDAISWYLVLDRQCNGAAAIPGDILQSPLTFESFRDLENIQRFKVLKRINIQLNVSGLGEDSGTMQLSFQAKTGRFHVNVNIPIYYSGVTNNINEIKSNNLLMMAISKHGDIRIEYKARIRFTG